MRRGFRTLGAMVVGVLLGAAASYVAYSLTKHSGERAALSYCCKPADATSAAQPTTSQTVTAQQVPSSSPIDVTEEVKRYDPPKEASPDVVSRLLSKTTAISLNCWSDVDSSTCGFFTNAVAADLQQEHVNVYLNSNEEPLALAMHSFVALPVLLPQSSGQVVLRLIETGTPQKLFVGGTCYDLSRPDWGAANAYLPIWHIQEGEGQDYGPLETDRAKAASMLARDFSRYWVNTVSENP